MRILCLDDEYLALQMLETYCKKNKVKIRVLSADSDMMEYKSDYLIPTDYKSYLTEKVAEAETLEKIRRAIDSNKDRICKDIEEYVSQDLDDERNYLETSGTALIAYGLLKGVRLGYLPERFKNVAIKAFDGIVNKYLSRNEDGSPRLGGICLVAGLGGAQHRDGSLEYYFSEPVVENEAKGVAPLILAYTELLRLK